MKFIKVMLDKNYEQLTGDYLATMLPVFGNKEQRRVEIPMVVET